MTSHSEVGGTVELSIDQLRVLIRYVGKITVVELQSDDDVVPLYAALRELKATWNELMETGS